MHILLKAEAKMMLSSLVKTYGLKNKWKNQGSLGYFKEVEVFKFWIFTKERKTIKIPLIWENETLTEINKSLNDKFYKIPCFFVLFFFINWEVTPIQP